MTSSLIPDVDLVPSVASRVVTIDVTDMQEGAPAEGHIDFTLPCDLHIPADDKIIRAGSVRVTLVDGKGEVRLPTYDADARTVDGSDDWVILVKKSWSSKGCGHGRGCGCGGTYAIRVPEGTTQISLADLPAVRELTMRERIWRITGAAATVSEGPEWDVDARVRGSIIEMDWTVPPGGTAWGRPPLGASTHLDNLERGEYIRVGSFSTSQGYPFNGGGTSNISVPYDDGTNGAQTISITDENGTVSYIRRRTSGTWNPWRSLAYGHVQVAAGSSVNDLTTPGAYPISSSSPVLDGPPGWEGRTYTVETIPLGGGWLRQEATDADQNRRSRARRGRTIAWDSWETPATYAHGVVPEGTDLKTVTAVGVHQVTTYTPVEDNPPGWQGSSYTLEALPMGQMWLAHRATNEHGEEAFRVRLGQSVESWQDWTTPSRGVDSGTGLQARLTVESSGQWSTATELVSYMDALTEHPDVEKLVIGKTVQGRDIHALRIGRPTDPAFLAVGGQHGDEPGCPHGFLLWARQLVEARSTIHMDMCVLIVPLLNVDSWLSDRQNANGVDLNRDWEDFAQPETQAVQSLIDSHDVIATVDGHSFGYPREVSVKTPTTAATEVMARSQGLFDSVIDSVRADGQFAREYAPANNAGMHHVGMAELDIASIILEVPSGFGQTQVKPNHYWQTRMAALSINAAAHKAWEWTPTYPSDLVASNAPGA